MDWIRGTVLACAMLFGSGCAAPIAEMEGEPAGDIDAPRLVKVMADW